MNTSQDTSLALEADGVDERAGAGVRLQALAPVAHPRLAEVADGALTQTKHTSNYHLSTVDWPSAAFGNGHLCDELLQCLGVLCI